ncbi:MAG: inositol monophosphatase family protein [Candidatus Acetothermia bacterium]
MSRELLKLAISAAKDAGELLIDGLGETRDISQKSGPTDLVTQFDHAAQDLISERIREKYPAHAILAEEEYDLEGNATKWIVDPLDGTTNYIYNYPLFCVSIAVEREGHLSVGVVHVPVINETFTAIRDEGAWLNGERINVSDTVDFSRSLLSTGFPYDEEMVPAALEAFSRLVREARGIRRDGAAAMDLSFVAAGRFDGFWELGLSPWDVAAGSLIVEESGGTVTDFDGEEYDLYESEGIVASNGKIHDELLQRLQK